ncbi:MAG: hypothetical protein JSU05_07830 [Bacteroidetes bacterium]|nr:hypothetical protein [Bacteroidota bacterium]
MRYTSISHISNEHNDWLRALEFYDKEFFILESRLADVAVNNSSREIMAGVEHFQNQFVVQRNNIDELQHSIRENLAKVKAEVAVAAGHVEDDLVAEHDALREDFMGFEKIVLDLRHEFNRFLAKYL